MYGLSYVASPDTVVREDESATDNGETDAGQSQSLVVLSDSVSNHESMKESTNQGSVTHEHQ